MDIDKDIELVSNLKNVVLKGKVNEHYIYTKIPEEYLNAIENVLADREMWKKIAEKLAEYITITDINEDVICDGVPEEICEQRAIGDCKQCILDWARKEVDNEEV